MNTAWQVCFPERHFARSFTCRLRVGRGERKKEKQRKKNTKKKLFGAFSFWSSLSLLLLLLSFVLPLILQGQRSIHFQINAAFFKVRVLSLPFFFSLFAVLDQQLGVVHQFPKWRSHPTESFPTGRSSSRNASDSCFSQTTGKSLRQWAGCSVLPSSAIERRWKRDSRGCHWTLLIFCDFLPLCSLWLLIYL